MFIQFLPIIEREAWDERNFVKKAVNWALRQIGKRNNTLKPLAIATAERISKQNSKSAKWIASDALRELTR
jgi:3-methyladenine DNA glycosylase AlkD